METTTADGATAIAVLATLRLSGTIVGGPVVDIPVGTVILAEAICERPLQPTPTATATATATPTATPTQPTAPPTQPTVPPTGDPTQPPTAPTTKPTLPVTGSSGSGLWWLLGTGLTMVAAGTAARLILRRSRTELDM